MSRPFPLSVLAIFLIALILPACPALAGGQYSLGVEGFADNYKEPDPTLRVDNQAFYGSLTAGYMHTGDAFFTGIDGRLSLGESNYSSTSGTSKNTPQYEAELRLRTGYTFMGMGGKISPYIGLGTRLYYDHSQNTVTSLGFVGYDRRLAQIYVPVGVGMAFTDGEWQIDPTFEYDQFVYGRVNSRLGSVGPTYSDVNNNQHNGYGLRASLMFGRQWGSHFWEVGPFARYWNIRDSDLSTDKSNRGWVEPHNQRIQAGAALRVLF